MNAKIAKVARYLRKTNKIQNTSVMNSKVFNRLKDSPEEANVLVIKDLEDLKKYAG